MKAARIMVRSTDGHDWQFGLYTEAVADRVLRGLTDSPTGQAGVVARIAELAAVDIISAARADRYETDRSRHRLAWRAIERAQRDGTRAYAIHGHRRVRLTVRRGALGGQASYSGPRYLIEGREYVLCANGRFEPAESRDANGRLTSYCTSVVAE